MEHSTSNTFKPARRRVLKTVGVAGLGIPLQTGTAAGQADEAAQNESSSEFNADQNWPSYKFNSGNTSYAPNNTGPQREVEEVWEFDINSTSETFSAPVIMDNTAYIASYSESDGGIYAVDLYTGTEEWSFQTRNGGALTPTAHNENIYLPTAQGDLYSFNKDTGEEDWQIDITGTEDDDDGYASVWGTCGVYDDAIYFASLDTLYSLSLDDGSEKWSFDAHNTFTPAIGGGSVFTRISQVNSGTDVTNWIIAIDSATGTEQWRYRLEYGLPSSVAFDGEYVYFTNQTDFGPENKYVYALNPNDGSKVWEHPVDGNVFTTPSIDEDNVYVSTQNGTLYALSRNDGSEVWNKNISWSNGSPPTMSVVGGTGYICDQDQVIALDVESGETMWTFSIADPSLVTVANNSLFVGSGDTVRCLAPELDPQISIPNNGTNAENDISFSASGSLSSSENLIQNYSWNINSSNITNPNNQTISIESIDTSDPTIELSVTDVYGRSTTTNRVIEYQANQSTLFQDISLAGILLPTFLIGGGGIAGAAMFARRRSQKTATEPSSDSSPTDTSGETESQQDSVTGEANVDVAHLQQRATEKINDATEAEADGDFERVLVLYRDAITDIEQAINKAESDAQEDLQTTLTETKTALATISELSELRESVETKLQAAERSFKEAIARFAASNQTVAKIRFRQARDAFNEAQQAIADSDKDVLAHPIAVSFEEEATLPSMALKDLASIEESTLATLSAVDIESVADLEADTDELTPPVVADLRRDDKITDEEVALLTMLSWYYEGESQEFTSEELISRRYDQAEYGFDQSI